MEDSAEEHHVVEPCGWLPSTVSKEVETSPSHAIHLGLRMAVLGKEDPNALDGEEAAAAAGGGFDGPSPPDAKGCGRSKYGCPWGWLAYRTEADTFPFPLFHMAEEGEAAKKASGVVDDSGRAGRNGDVSSGEEEGRP